MGTGFNEIGLGGSTKWLFNSVLNLDEIRFSNIARSADRIATEYANQNSPSTFETAAGQETAPATGAFAVGNNLTVGDGSHAMTADASTATGAISVGGSVTISTGATFLSASSTSVTISGNFTNSGTFTHSGGTVIFSGAGTSVISSSASMAFKNLTIATPGKTVKFQKQTTNVPIFTIAGTFTANGTAGNLVSIQSDTPGSQWLVHFNSAQTVSYVNVRDSGCDAGTANVTMGGQNINGGNNGSCWFVSALFAPPGYFGGGSSSYAPVEGAAIANGGGTAVSGSTGAGTIVRVQQVVPETGACSGNTCTVTVSPTTAGNLGVILFVGGSGGVSGIQSVSGGGTWTANNACLSSGGAPSQISDIAYNLNLTSGATTITVTARNLYAYYVVYAEYSGGTWSLDGVCQTLNNQASTANPKSPSITTTGSKDLLVTVVDTAGMHYGSATVTGTGWASPFTMYMPGPAFDNSQAAGDDALNVGPGTYQATFTTFSGGSTFSSSAFAFKASVFVPASQGGGGASGDTVNGGGQGQSGGSGNQGGGGGGDTP